MQELHIADVRSLKQTTFECGEMWGDLEPMPPLDFRVHAEIVSPPTNPDDWTLHLNLVHMHTHSHPGEAFLDVPRVSSRDFAAVLKAAAWA